MTRGLRMRVSFSNGPESLSDRTRKAFQLAHQEAQRLNHSSVGPEHLLIGLAKETESPASVLLREFGYGLRWLRNEIERVNPPAVNSTGPGILPYNSELEACLNNMVFAAESSGITPLTPEFVLAALIHDREGVAARVLRQRRFAWWLLNWKLKWILDRRKS